MTHGYCISQREDKGKKSPQHASRGTDIGHQREAVKSALDILLRKHFPMSIIDCQREAVCTLNLHSIGQGVLIKQLPFEILECIQKLLNKEKHSGWNLICGC